MAKTIAFWGGLCLLALVAVYLATSVAVCTDAGAGNLAGCAQSTGLSLLQSPAALLGLCLSMLAIQYSKHRREPPRRLIR